MPTCILSVSLLCLAYASWSPQMCVVFLPAPFLSSDFSSLFFLPHNFHFYSLVHTGMDSPSFFTLNARRGSIDNRRGMVFLLSLSFFNWVSLRLLIECSLLPLPWVLLREWMEKPPSPAEFSLIVWRILSTEWFLEITS